MEQLQLPKYHLKLKQKKTDFKNIKSIKKQFILGK